MARLGRGGGFVRASEGVRPTLTCRESPPLWSWGVNVVRGLGTLLRDHAVEVGFIPGQIWRGGAKIKCSRVTPRPRFPAVILRLGYDTALECTIMILCGIFSSRIKKLEDTNLRLYPTEERRRFLWERFVRRRVENSHHRSVFR
jgi:hypothetical protein